MSYDDFCRCTPSEFSAVAAAWSRNRESLVHQSWEQTRKVVLAALQPYSKKTLRGPDVLPFSWDKKKTPPKPVEKSTRERMEAVRARLKGNQ